MPMKNDRSADLVFDQQWLLHLVEDYLNNLEAF